MAENSRPQRPIRSRMLVSPAPLSVDPSGMPVPVVPHPRSEAAVGPSRGMTARRRHPALLGRRSGVPRGRRSTRSLSISGRYQCRVRRSVHHHPGGPPGPLARGRAQRPPDPRSATSAGGDRPHAGDAAPRPGRVDDCRRARAGPAGARAAISGCSLTGRPPARAGSPRRPGAAARRRGGRARCAGARGRPRRLIRLARARAATGSGEAFHLRAARSRAHERETAAATSDDPRHLHSEASSTRAGDLPPRRAGPRSPLPSGHAQEEARRSPAVLVHAPGASVSSTPPRATDRPPRWQ